MFTSENGGKERKVWIKLNKIKKKGERVKMARRVSEGWERWKGWVMRLRVEGWEGEYDVLLRPIIFFWVSSLFVLNDTFYSIWMWILKQSGANSHHIFFALLTTAPIFENTRHRVLRLRFGVFAIIARWLKKRGQRPALVVTIPDTSGPSSNAEPTDIYKNSPQSF